MKKILVLGWCLALCLGLLLYSFGQPEQTAIQNPTTISTQQNTTTSSNEATSSTEPTQVTESQPDPQHLYVLNCDPEREVAWELLAYNYTQQLGVEVTVINDLSEQTDSDAATLMVTNRGMAQELKADCLDLSDTAAYAQLAGPGFCMADEEKVWGLTSEIAIFGLVYNEDLLARAGYTRVDIDCFADLKAVAEHITLDAEKLGFGAFANAKGNLSQLLSSVPGDCRTIWDLYSQNRVEGSVADSQAVFCLGSQQDLAELSKNDKLRLAMLPMYVGGENEQNQTFCAVSTRYWCIKNSGSEENIQAAVAFLNYLVSPRVDGTVPVDSLEILAPYRQAAYASNNAESLLRSDIAAGKECLICVNPAVPEGLMEALAIYETDPTDENWSAVEILLG